MTGSNESRTTDPVLQRMRRKRDQAWDLAGLARQDGDTRDELRWMLEAKDWERQIREYKHDHE